jgi:hypothetical protein
MAPIAEALAKQPCREAIIDGEIAAPDENGVTRVGDVRGALDGAACLFRFRPALA